MLNTYSTDLDYINKISYKLTGFKKINSVYNCRCPFCGDSKKLKKQRFFIYTKKGSINVNCKNCGYGKSFYNFMKDFDSFLFDEYKKDAILDNFKTKRITSSINNLPVVEKKKIVVEKITCIPILSLPENHKAYQYLINRSFDKNQIKYLFYTDDFKSVASEVNLESSINLLENEPRIIIPFYDIDGNIKAIQGRSLEQNSKMRYITIKASVDNDKIYGLERISFNELIYVVEGPLDSLFIKNCVATCDSNLLSCKFGDVFIFDNQCRNKEIITLMESAIKQGKNIVIWPNSTNKKQDINDLITLGINQESLMKVIKLRTFSGIRAHFELSKWRKV